MPQWPWSVYSHRHRSAMITRSSPTSALMSAIATWEMPSGSSAPLPTPSLSAGTPNTMMPPTRAPNLGEGIDEPGDRRLSGRHVDPQPELGGGLRRLRADHADHGHGVRF